MIYDMSNLRKFKNFLSITGLVIMAVSVLLAYFSLSGMFEDSSKKEFLKWVMTGETGLNINSPAAQSFIKDFPPPEAVRAEKITHITKWKQRLENGLPFEAQINYMLADNSRTSYVATLDDVRAWANKTSYPWLAWLLSLIGFIELLLSTVIGLIISRIEQNKS